MASVLELINDEKKNIETVYKKICKEMINICIQDYKDNDEVPYFMFDELPLKLIRSSIFVVAFYMTLPEYSMNMERIICFINQCLDEIEEEKIYFRNLSDFIVMYFIMTRKGIFDYIKFIDYLNENSEYKNRCSKNECTLIRFSASDNMNILKLKEMLDIYDKEFKFPVDSQVLSEQTKTINVHNLFNELVEKGDNDGLYNVIMDSISDWSALIRKRQYFIIKFSYDFFVNKRDTLLNNINIHKSGEVKRYFKGAADKDLYCEQINEKIVKVNKNFNDTIDVGEIEEDIDKEILIYKEFIDINRFSEISEKEYKEKKQNYLKNHNNSVKSALFLQIIDEEKIVKKYGETEAKDIINKICKRKFINEYIDDCLVNCSWALERKETVRGMLMVLDAWKEKYNSYDLQNLVYTLDKILAVRNNNYNTNKRTYENIIKGKTTSVRKEDIMHLYKKAYKNGTEFEMNRILTVCGY